MPAPADSRAVIAATRFGFAARAGDLATIGRDPQGWVLKQLARPPAQLDGTLPSSARMVAALLQMRRDKKDPADRKDFNQQVRGIYLAEVEARIRAAAESDAPLGERMVQFWSNHFTVSALRPMVHGFCGAFEREAIRPYVTGRFADMLLAVERHPAMLFYLDNVLSIGPDSPAGRRQDKGLNENLGREILELHTLGVDGGYTQADVEALARILTGWSIARLVDPDAGSFRFYDRLHEPGSKQLLGRVYGENGYGEGEAALRDLARHPATATHVATKLARHFIADAPPPDAVQRIAQVFRQTDGGLAQVTAAVVREKAVWQTPFAKVRAPADFVIAACRVAGFVPPAEMLVGSLRLLDHQPFFAPSPAGWPDTAQEWISPEAVLHRADWSQAFAARVPDPPDPAAAATAAFGDSLPEETMRAISRAPSRREGLALMLAAPEFQRR